MNEPKPFGQLPIEERVAIFRAHQEGTRIEVYSFPHWFNCIHPTWSLGAIYRIAPEPSSINWDHVAPKWVALAMDDDGEWYLCTEVPYKKERFWDATDGADWIAPELFASFKPGTCDWTESLVLHPGTKGEEPVNRFTNFYQCICGERWEDESPHTNDDRCPECDMANSPYKSEDL